MLFFLLFFVVTIINGQQETTQCSFQGCDCPTINGHGNACYFSSASVLTIRGNQSVTGGSFVMDSVDSVLHFEPGSSLSVPQGAIVLHGIVNVTLEENDQLLAHYITIIDSIAIVTTTVDKWTIHMNNAHKYNINSLVENGKYTISVNARKENNSSSSSEEEKSSATLSSPGNVWLLWFILFLLQILLQL